MIIIFDLDYTLLDLEKFKQGLAQAFSLSREEFDKSYQSNFKDRNIDYNADKHLLILGKNKDEQAREAVINFLKTIDCYLLPRAEEFFKKIKFGNRLIMMSRGDKQWQKAKFDHLKIKKYFKTEDIIYVSDDKIKHLDSIGLSDEKIVIVNDNAREGLAMKKQLKNSRLFLVDGPYSRNVSHRDKIYTLKELEKIYEKNRYFSRGQRRAHEIGFAQSGYAA